MSNKAVAILGAAIEMHHALNGARVSILLDKTNDAGRSIDLAQDYFSYLYRDEPTASFPIITPIHKKSIQCAKNTPPLQAADFYAWELRKSYVNKKEFYESEPYPRADDPGVTQRLMSWFFENRRQHVKSRGLESITIPFEPDRRSFIALDVATVNSAHIWDYRAIKFIARKWCL